VFCQRSLLEISPGDLENLMRRKINGRLSNYLFMQDVTLYATCDETSLIQKIVSGETALFEVFIRRYNQALYKIARCYGFSHEDAKDLMQETHVTAYQHLGSFEGRSSYKTWVCKIMVNKCLYKTRYGSSKYEVKAMDDEYSQPIFSYKESTENRVLNRELSLILEKSLEGLPLHYRTVFMLREVEGLSVAETASLLELTPTNVKVRLNRAKALLQKQLEKYYSRAQLYEFNLIYCDEVVNEVFKRITAMPTDTNKTISK
jgi:RNA polymerase sigma factor (sigma-70 family)